MKHKIKAVFHAVVIFIVATDVLWHVSYRPRTLRRYVGDVILAALDALNAAHDYMDHMDKQDLCIEWVSGELWNDEDIEWVNGKQTGDDDVRSEPF